MNTAYDYITVATIIGSLVFFVYHWIKAHKE